ncbi:hypothetical protein SAMN05216246_101265 [Actinomyces denticolens]|uniref:Uncharacterized protein n=1 Tax=Actinomyces denticolens TaxID=52767 RepID=A0ABY1HZE0_9ACTO|nr:hypothetical protein SAMN05216246_101265 [Actinomyces denticolens]
MSCYTEISGTQRVEGPLKDKATRALIFSVFSGGAQTSVHTLTSHAEYVADFLPRQAGFAGGHRRLVERALSTADSDLRDCDPRDCDPRDCDPRDCDPRDCDPRDCDPRENGIIYRSQRIWSLSTVGVLDLVE